MCLQKSNNAIDVMQYIDMLDDFVDQSDPDINLSNIHHLYQTAERVRENG